MWFDAAPGDVDAAPAEAKWITYLAAAFAFPGVVVFLWLAYPLAQAAATGFGG